MAGPKWSMRGLDILLCAFLTDRGLGLIYVVHKCTDTSDTTGVPGACIVVRVACWHVDGSHLIVRVPHA